MNAKFEKVTGLSRLEVGKKGRMVVLVTFSLLLFPFHCYIGEMLKSAEVLQKPLLLILRRELMYLRVFHRPEFEFNIRLKLFYNQPR